MTFAVAAAFAVVASREGQHNKIEPSEEMIRNRTTPSIDKVWFRSASAVSIPQLLILPQVIIDGCELVTCLEAKTLVHTFMIFVSKAISELR